MTTLQRDAKAAADLLEREGWNQGWYRSRDGKRYCAEGAALKVCDDPGYARLCGALTDRIGLPVSIWNDAPGRTAAEVIAVFRAIERGQDADK